MYREYFRLISSLLIFLTLSACKPVKIADAEKAERKGEYHKAAVTYNALYKRTNKGKREQRAYLAWRAAENYTRLGQVVQALSSYQAALRYGYPDSLLYLRIACSFQAMGRYKDALSYYDRFGFFHPNDANLQTGKEGCLIAMKENAATDYRVKKSSLLNSTRGDFSATYAPDGSVIYFSSSRSKDPSVEQSNITGLKPNDIYYIKQDNKGRFSRADSLAGGINTDQDEGTPAISSDGKTLYYTYAEQNELYRRTAQIYSSRTSGEGGWSKGTLVDLWGDSLRMAAHPAPSPDGKWLYFVSEGGGAYGGKDLYRSAIREDGYGFPENLGQEINTVGDELFPHMATDSVLYFSSTGRPGYGGLDIYRATLDAAGHWTVIHLPPPINSSADDFGLVFNPAKRAIDDPIAENGLFSSTRQDAKARPHLYEFSKPAVHIYIEGFVYNREGEPIPKAEIRIIGATGPVGNGLVYSRDDGSYRILVDQATEYVMLAGATGYLNRFARFATEESRQDETYYVDFYLASRIAPEALKNIFYDFDKATLRPESKKSLDELVEILNDNPDISIKLSSHADRKGSDNYNIALSLRRAKSVGDYLVANGIDSLRLFPIGQGKQQPHRVTVKEAASYPFLQQDSLLTEAFVLRLTPEQQQIADQLNRRTEFSVVPSGELEKMRQEAKARADTTAKEKSKQETTQSKTEAPQTDTTPNVSLPESNEKTEAGNVSTETEAPSQPVAPEKESVPTPADPEQSNTNKQSSSKNQTEQTKKRHP